MRSPTRTHVTAFAISAAILVAGCSGSSEINVSRSASPAKGELFLEPVADQGPDPFTHSTAEAAEPPAPVTRTPQPSAPGSTTAEGGYVTSGDTPGLYGGTRSVGSCDVEKQVAFLTADQAKEGAFASASGISQASVPGFLRGLTPVVLRSDTRVTNQGFRAGEATGFQSVLQAGTAVLVDERGMPRVRCACGNPLKPPVAFRGTPRPQGQQWSGFRPTEVVVVTPAPQIITNIVIVNITDNTWIERKSGDEGRHDKPVPPPPSPSHTSRPPSSSTSPSPSPSTSASQPPSSGSSSSPATDSQSRPATSPGSTDTQSPSGDGSGEDLGPDTVPDSPDQPGGGLVPDATSIANVHDS
ncbi:hypothetical protein EOT10_20150 [Streptomyces antnestii]|uniref:DUF6777 domain-containing protein n=1 Tax=Streptomyces antnestii TaxID=2494256 RepID=A0A437PKK0_9ACTN|nr:DUF6777 domain-containing protein [Streptomyces sp. San01]RVU22792.1 hypothetical protein EOT10_20150 [Streptomyces sp. San01]